MSQIRSRQEILLSWPFITSVVLLGVNDWLLKTAFPGLVTGKLSDFAGVLALQLFLFGLFGPRVSLSAGVAMFFAWWKSPLSQSFIDAWNAALPTIDRVIDPSDLLALAILPIGHRIAAHYRANNRDALRWQHVVMSVVTIMLFCATSRSPWREYSIDYYYTTSVDSLQSGFQQLTENEDLISEIGEWQGTVRLDSLGRSFEVRVQFGQESERSRMRLTGMDLEDDSISHLQEFESRVARKLPGLIEKDKNIIFKGDGVFSWIGIIALLISGACIAIGVHIIRSETESNIWRTAGQVVAVLFFVAGGVLLLFAIAIFAGHWHSGGPA